MAYNRGSFEKQGGDLDLPNYVYYNCDIINNKTDDLNALNITEPDPQIRFNETRDTALIKDSSQYEFSIIRFTMNGANRDLPLFIPNIATGQTNVNLTNYAVAITLQQSWTTNLGVISFNLAPVPTRVIYVPEILNPVLAPLPNAPLIVQDLSSRYYWCLTYTHWLDTINTTLDTAHATLYAAFQAAWAAYPGLTDPFPFANFTAFAASCQTPQITFNETLKDFTIFGDSDGYGQRLETFTALPYVAGTAVPATRPQERLFFNTNMAGLFANFGGLYWNTTNITAITINQVLYPAFPTAVPPGYVREMIFSNEFYTNVADFRLAPYAGVAPLGYVPVAKQKVYYKLIQDYKSVDSIWSPIGAIVFTTSLLPIKFEAASQPNILGTSNLGDSAPTSRSAFTPIITDVALDTALGGADDYRQFIYYAPAAEYRMSDLSSSKQEIRNIDVSVFWKFRLTGQLFPINMFNLSSVSIKMLFRKKGLKEKGAY